MAAEAGEARGETVAALAGAAGGAAEGDTGRVVRGVAAIGQATETDVVYAASERAVEQALASPAGCIVLDEQSAAPGRTIIRARNPKLAFARIAARLQAPSRSSEGVHATAVVDASARLAAGVSVGPYAVIGARADIGAGTAIGAHCVIGDGARIGEQCTLYPRVTIYPGVVAGSRVILHSGVVLGSDGFGYVFDGKRYEKFPQVGTLEIGDDVEIGANTTIDRGALGPTRIGRGVKIDNLVQVAHNVTIGDNVVIASQTGISGSAVIEPYAVIAGQVGIGDHVHIESGAVLGGQCGVLPNKIIRKGQTVWGTPARPIKEYLAQLGVLARLTRKR